MPHRLFRMRSFATCKVLCESAQRISGAAKGRHPEVNWRSISGPRNVRVHDYFDVDLETVSEITQRDIKRPIGGPGIHREQARARARATALTPNSRGK